MALSMDEKRQEYLKKIRAVEQTNLAIQSGTGTYMSPSTPLSYSGGSITVPSGEFAFPQAVFTMAELAKYPGMVQDYAKNSVKTLGRIDINTSMPSGKILLPSGNRAAYSATVCEYIFEHGGVRECGLYTPINDAKFEMKVRSDNPYGNWIRKDFAYYLEMLYDRVSPRLKSKKIYVSSAYRSPFYNYDLYSRMLKEGTAKKRVYWSPHLGGYGADLCATGKDLQEIIAAAKAMGFGGIGVGKTFVHIDIGPKASPWEYDY